MVTKQTRITLTVLFLLGLILLGAPNAVVAQNTLEITESKSWFEGTSTVRDWACKTVPMSGFVETDDEIDSVQELLKSAPERSLTASVAVPSKDIKCEQGERMNNHMRDALEADEYEYIKYKVENVQSVEAPDEGSDTYTVNVQGTLSITGDERDVPLTLAAVPQSDGTLRLTGSKGLNIKTFGVEPPTVMWTITVYKDITVHLDITLE